MSYGRKSVGCKLSFFFHEKTHPLREVHFSHLIAQMFTFGSNSAICSNSINRSLIVYKKTISNCVICKFRLPLWADSWSTWWSPLSAPDKIDTLTHVANPKRWRPNAAKNWDLHMRNDDQETMYTVPLRGFAQKSLWCWHCRVRSGRGSI